MPANDPGNIVTEVPAFARADWKEEVAGNMPGGGDVFGWENSEAITMGYIPNNVRASFTRAVLGYSYVDPATKKLKRVLPLFHPEYNFLVCQGVHLQPRVPISPLKILAVNPSVQFDQARYYQTEVTLRFRPVQWEYKEDADTTYEWERFTYDEDRVANLDILSQLQGNFLKFAEGAVGNPRGEEFRKELGLPVIKEQMNLVWEQVPKDFVVSGMTSSQGGLPARKILPRLGTLNDAVFLGYAAGTLALMGVRFQRYIMPIRYVSLPAFYYRITFNFQGFDPTKGVVGSSFHGHNLMPWRNDGLWYYATMNGSTSGQPFLRSTDFNKLFEHVDA